MKPVHAIENQPNASAKKRTIQDASAPITRSDNNLGSYQNHQTNTDPNDQPQSGFLLDQGFFSSSRFTSSFFFVLFFLFELLIITPT